MTRAGDDAARSNGEERRLHTADTQTTAAKPHRPFIPHVIRILAIPIILGWVALTVVVNVAVPSLEIVGENHSAPMAPLEAPSNQAMMRMGHNFHEFSSNSMVMVVVESQQPLGDAAHRYYDDIVRKLRKDTKHVQHIQDFWGDRFTAAGAQSADAKASYVQVNIAGNQGTTQANKSVEAVRKVVDDEPAPPGVKAHVTGSAALSDDMHVIGNDSLAKITLFTLGAIAIMLLLVYRSIVTTLIQLFMTFVALACARGIVAVLAYNNAFGLTTFAANILTMLAIAAGTDYGIFLIGRYQEARRAWVRADHCRRDVLPQLLPVALVPHHGRPGGHRHDRRGGGGLDAGPGRGFPGQPIRPVRKEGSGPRPAVAAGRHRRRTLARTGFRGERSCRPGWHGRVTGI
jgi:putative drug exporter of the RND superfamily